MNKAPPTVDTELPQMLDDAARKIVALRMTSAALFFLEAHRPLSGVFYNLALFAEPFLLPVFGSHRIHIVQRLLENPKTLDLFIKRLESYSLAETGSREHPDHA